MKSCISLIIAVAYSLSVHAAPAWYFGEITRVWYYNEDGFIVTLNSSGLSDCKYRYAYFKASVIGRDQERSLYSMALSAFHSGQRVGIVIDKQGSGEYCVAKSMDVRR